ncbi:YggW family oxidoreductase [Candidatus Endobugula sertula]|uniref:Heme chaperone HemW n=1 Tax=Candidatus Endobugula sertula TaxID=62101 RepID=A0A1D2QSM2_9GAMM|nr:YggW family oxidoreductase [Candidatus Endobugula sertula]
MLSSSTPFLRLSPLSLYIHIPWCILKCPYCDFNSHEVQLFDEDAYIKQLMLDLSHEQQWLDKRNAARKLQSIFFGGGTPSLFSAKGIGTILSGAENIVGFETDIEITLEANPGTFEQEKFSDFFHAGVNRLSIGVQSFNESQLKILKRIHNSNEAQQAVLIAQKAGFDNINLDLMHGLPKQTVDDAKRDLDIAIGLGVQHISWYQLTIEPNTVFYHQPPPLPNDEMTDNIQYHGAALLTEHGYQQYEVSAFSQQATYQSRHNTHYWQFGDYIGIGAGAHGKLTDHHNSQIIRRQKARLPEHYLSSHGPPHHKESQVKRHELALEFMMNALRLNHGVPINYFSERTGLPFSHVASHINNLQKKGLLKNSDQRIVTTKLGHRFLNSVLETFSHSDRYGY